MRSDLLRAAEREQRRQLEDEARQAVEMRARLPTLVREAIERDRRRIAAKLARETDLCHAEIADVLEQSTAWVSQAIAEQENP